MKILASSSWCFRWNPFWNIFASQIGSSLLKVLKSLETTVVFGIMFFFASIESTNLGFEKRQRKKNIEETTGTPPKTNMEAKNDGLEDDFPFPGVYSQVPC